MVYCHRREEAEINNPPPYGCFTKTDLVIVEGLVSESMSGLNWFAQDILYYPDIENILRTVFVTCLIALIKYLTQAAYCVSQLQEIQCIVAGKVRSIGVASHSESTVRK